MTLTKSLDIGCGSKPRNFFETNEIYGIDVSLEENDFFKIADLTVENIPFPDDFFDYVTAFDFIEHVPRVIYVPHRRNAFVELMNEIYRVLKVGGTFLSFTPAYPSPEAFRDPTNCNFITQDTFPLYFDDSNRWAKNYGFTGAFRIKGQEWKGPHLLSVLEKVQVES